MDFRLPIRFAAAFGSADFRISRLVPGARPEIPLGPVIVSRESAIDVAISAGNTPVALLSAEVATPDDGLAMTGERTQSGQAPDPFNS